MANLSRRIRCISSLALVTALFQFGCQPKSPVPVARVARQMNYAQPLPEGQLALRKISRDSYPDFSKCLSTENPTDLRKSAENSLTWFGRAGSGRKYPYLDIDHGRAIASIRAFIAMIDSGAFTLDAAAFNARIADEFDVYQSIGAPLPDESGYSNKVLFTGYFTPTYDASLTQGGAYQWPLYKRPADLISDPNADTAGRKAADGSIVSYLSRREIESGALAGGELVWLTSRWNAYVITVQGSARLRLPGGRIMEVGYAGSNGCTYGSPGIKMVHDGIIAERDLSFDTMRRYFADHPESMNNYLWQNPRTVFFHEVHGGPFGALNVPVTQLASIATDKDVYPPGMVAFLNVPTPADSLESHGSSPISWADGIGRHSYYGFMLDQDRGGAIRSAGRCDIYMGIGQHAEQTAGYQLNAGELYYLVVKPDRTGK